MRQGLLHLGLAIAGIPIVAWLFAANLGDTELFSSRTFAALTACSWACFAISRLCEVAHVHFTAEIQRRERARTGGTGAG